MIALQTRIFTRFDDPQMNWSDTLLGRVIAPIVTEFRPHLGFFWFSRYHVSESQDPANLEDRGDCDYAALPDEYKHPAPNTHARFHRSIRFRFSISDNHRESFEERLDELLKPHEYAITGVIEWVGKMDQSSGPRFLSTEKGGPGRPEIRSRLVLNLYQAISEVVLDALVGPDATGRYRAELNGDLQQNPNGSTFESLHHLFCNITEVPLAVHASMVVQTNWMPPNGQQALLQIKF